MINYHAVQCNFTWFRDIMGYTFPCAQKSQRPWFSSISGHAVHLQYLVKVQIPWFPPPAPQHSNGDEAQKSAFEKSA